MPLSLKQRLVKAAPQRAVPQQAEAQQAEAQQTSGRGFALSRVLALVVVLEVLLVGVVGPSSAARPAEAEAEAAEVAEATVEAEERPAEEAPAEGGRGPSPTGGADLGRLPQEPAVAQSAYPELRAREARSSGYAD